MQANQFHEFLNGIDYLDSILPNIAETDKLLGEAALTKLSKQACFIIINNPRPIRQRAR